MSKFLVSPGWLNEHLGDPTVRIVDASWYLPAQNRDPRSEFEAGHIPGAVFFDIDAIADRSTTLPHMLPNEQEFGAAAGQLGISEEDTIVVYDSAGLLSAPRVWWTFRAFGAMDVRILDGGLQAWKTAGYRLDLGPSQVEPRTFNAHLKHDAAVDFAQVLDMIAAGETQIVDARSVGRFSGKDPEPRPELSSGHMPGALNLPFDRLVRDGRLIEPQAVAERFKEAGVDLDRPVVTTCGSGITAAILTFALATTGKEDVSVYDGSWTEWASRPDAPIVKDEP